MLPCNLPAGVHRLEAERAGADPVLYTLEIPADLAAPVPLVLALHFAFPGPKPDPHTGARLLDSFRPGLAALRGLVLAPDSLGGRWTDPQNEFMAFYLTRCVMQCYPIDPKRILITGFSRGGEGAWHIGSRHQDLFTGAIPVAAPVAGGDKWRIPVYAIHAERDEIVPYRAAQEHCENLRAGGATIEFKSVPDLTHYQTAAYAPYLAEGVDWILNRWTK